MSDKLTAVINTWNEEKNIETCIKSLGPLGEYVDEVLVCDNYSSDRTVEIAKACGARVVFHERQRYVTPSRRFAYTQTESEWIFALDADERPTAALLTELRPRTACDDVDVYRFAKLQYMFGGFVRHGGWFCEAFPQLFRRAYFLSHYRADKEGAHEDFASVSDANRTIIIPKETGAYLIHYAYDDLGEFAERAFARYCRIEAEDQLARGQGWSLLRIALAPATAFLRQFLRHKGYKDGMRGLVLAILMAHYYQLIELNKWFLSTQRQHHEDGEQL